MSNNFKTNYLQNNTYIIVCKLGENIPKGIISYYSLVSVLDRAFRDKEIFDSFLFFSLLKKIELLYSLFFSGLAGLGVYAPQSEGVESDFSRPLPRPLRPTMMSRTAHYSQEKLSRPKIKNSRNFVAEYYRQNQA
jgi:hypothetical protein